MLAEQAFTTEAQLPKELEDQAVILAGEMAWTATDALRVVEWLSSHGVAVFGVELWRDAGGVPRWLASRSCTSGSPAECRREAAGWIEELDLIQPDPGNLFNLTW